MTVTVVLIVFLAVYAFVGAVFALNVWHASDRAAERFRGYPWLLRQIGRDNPKAWRASGLVMLAFGVAVIVGMAVLAVWRPPPLTTSAAILVLAVVAIVSVIILVRRHE